jgi:maltose alpha-D-glucosyltransferase / alpha-amylase
LIIFCEPDMSLNILEGPARARLESQLPDLLKAQRWFGGKARDVAAATIVDRIVLPSARPDTVLLIVDVAYGDGGHEMYAMPIAAAFGQEAAHISHEMPRAVLTHVSAGDKTQENGVLYDAMWNADAMHRLLLAIGQGARVPGETGTLQASPTSAYRSVAPSGADLTPRVLQTQQSNTSVAFGKQALLKLYRRVQPGINPDWEIGRYLTSHAFSHSPAVGGVMEYVRSGEPMTVALLQAFVPNEGDAWGTMLAAAEGFLARVLQDTAQVDSEAGRERSLWELAQSALSEPGRTLIGPALNAAGCLGRRTAALHLTLGGERNDPAFAPEPLTRAYLEARQQSMQQSYRQVMRLLTQRSGLSAGIREGAHALLTQEPNILALFHTLLDIREGGQRIRCHGDYHLGQVLWTGDDYIVTDFEGEPARPLHERRLKHSPLYDVAGMLRSFAYVSSSALAAHPVDQRGRLERWAGYWLRWVRAYFLGAYLADVRQAPFWPPSSTEAARLLTVHELEKAVYELGYELNNRPEWAAIPLKGITDIVHMSGVRAAA